MKCTEKELTGSSPSSFECSSNYLWIILENETFHKLMLYLVHEDGIKMKSFSPHSQRLQFLVFTLIPLKHGIEGSHPVKMLVFRILIRERPKIRILSSDLRLHNNWGSSFQGTRKNCLLLNKGSPNPHYILEYLVDNSAPPSSPRWDNHRDVNPQLTQRKKAY